MGKSYGMPLRPASWKDLGGFRASIYDEALDFLRMGMTLVAELPEDRAARVREVERLVRGLRRRARQRGEAVSVYVTQHRGKLFVSAVPLRLPKPASLVFRPVEVEALPVDLQRPLSRRRLREVLSRARGEALERGRAWVGLIWQAESEEAARRFSMRLRNACYRVLGSPAEGVVLRVLAVGREVLLLWKVGEDSE